MSEVEEISEVGQLLEQLLEKGVPEAMVEQLEDLILEVEGYLVAEGWGSNPAGQARFIFERLLQHSSRFYDLSLREEAKRCSG
jgi:hypothetical protein